jgi:multiple sugar transport system substrate-binding protein
MRRVVALAVAVTLAAAACSSSSSPSAGTPAPASPVASLAASPVASQAAPASPSPSGPDTSISGTLTVWHYETTDPYLALMNDEAKLFNNVYPNVTVKYVQVPFAQMTPKLLATAAAKQGPDVAVFQFGDVQSLAEAGVLQDMDSYWRSFGDASLFSPAVVKQVNGKVYTAQAYVNLIALWYNKDILDKYGIAPPTTMDEFEADLAKVKSGGDGGLAIDGKPGVDGWWTGMPFFFGQGIDMHMSGPDVAPTFARIRSWVDKGYVSKEAVTWDQDTVFNKFLTGKYAFAVDGNWYASNAAKATFKYGAVPIPTAAQPSSVYVGGEGEAIGAFTKNADLAWAYLQTTWFSKAGQILALKAVGTLPTRSDAAQDPAIASSPILPAFAQAVQTGTPLPITTAENSASTVFGDLWSAVLSGQKTPQQAATELAAKIPGILK